MKTSLLLTVLLFSLISCKMMDNAEKAAENSKKAADNSDTLRDLSTSLYISAVSGGSEDSRRQALTEMKAAESFDLKARYASSFIKAQTYQLINPMLKDLTVGDFERFFKDALLEDIPIVARAIAECMPQNGKIHVTKTKGCEGDVKAIAASLQETNKLYYQFSGSKNIKMLTMLDIVMDGLRAHYVENKRLDEMTDIQKKVLYYRKEFLYALHLRYKFLPIVAVAKISDLNSGMIDKLKMILTDWNPRNDKKGELTRSDAEFELALKVLKQSLAAKEFLKEIGEADLELPLITKKLLKNMDYEVTVNDQQIYTEIQVTTNNLLN